jgi:beta-lactamase class A
VTDWSLVERLIAAESSSGALGVAVSYSDGSQGSSFEHNAERQFRAASVVKIPLMIEVFRQAERGAFSLEDRHTVLPEQKTPGSGVLLHLHTGVEMTVNDLLYLTISISDNTATNMLIDLVGMQAVNDTMHALGMRDSNLRRPMRGRPAQAGEIENLATPRDYLHAVAAILDDRAASPESCAAMISLLERQQNDRRVARFLPASNQVRWGSKTGSLTGVTNDVGFVSTPRGTLAVAVFCEGFQDQHEAERVIGEIARAACESVDLLDGLA